MIINVYKYTNDEAYFSEWKFMVLLEAYLLIFSSLWGGGDGKLESISLLYDYVIAYIINFNALLVHHLLLHEDLFI